MNFKELNEKLDRLAEETMKDLQGKIMDDLVQVTEDLVKEYPLLDVNIIDQAIYQSIETMAIKIGYELQIALDQRKMSGDITEHDCEECPLKDTCLSNKAKDDTKEEKLVSL